MFGFFVKQTVNSRLGLIIYATLVPHMRPSISYNPAYLRLIPLLCTPSGYLGPTLVGIPPGLGGHRLAVPEKNRQPILIFRDDMRLQESSSCIECLKGSL